MMHLTNHVAEALPPSTTPASQSACAVWTEVHATTLASLERVVNEGGVFGAVTGPKSSGKSAIMTALLASVKSKRRVCIDIRRPDTISIKTVDNLKSTLQRIVNQSPHSIDHILITIDNAHLASQELLNLLNCLAAERTLFGSPQMIFAGEPDIWDRLASPEYKKLRRRIALRCSLAEPAHA